MIICCSFAVKLVVCSLLTFDPRIVVDGSDYFGNESRFVAQLEHEAMF